jgi:hypothetical protein
MAILIRFAPKGMTSAQYDAVGKRLEDAGAWPPAGLLAHVCFGDDGNLRVSEVWESRQQQEKFADVLMPALESEGVGMTSEPEFLEVEGYVFREASSDPGD